MHCPKILISLLVALHVQICHSNRGGSGDIADGLKDMAAFLEVVRVIKPKFWAMENVPRVKNILENILKTILFQRI